jgi:hypothetical protein
MRVLIKKTEAENLGLDWSKILSELHESPLSLCCHHNTQSAYRRIDIIEINEETFPGSDPSTHGFWISEEYNFFRAHDELDLVQCLWRVEKKPDTKRYVDTWRTVME